VDAAVPPGIGASSNSIFKPVRSYGIPFLMRRRPALRYKRSGTRPCAQFARPADFADAHDRMGFHIFANPTKGG